jgi:hypothetical protein
VFNNAKVRKEERSEQARMRAEFVETVSDISKKRTHNGLLQSSDQTRSAIFVFLVGCESCFGYKESTIFSLAFSIPYLFNMKFYLALSLLVVFAISVEAQPKVCDFFCCLMRVCFFLVFTQGVFLTLVIYACYGSCLHCPPCGCCRVLSLLLFPVLLRFPRFLTEVFFWTSSPPSNSSSLLQIRGAGSAVHFDGVDDYIRITPGCGQPAFPLYEATLMTWLKYEYSS